MAGNDVIVERAGDTEALLAYVENHLAEVVDDFKEELLDVVVQRNGVVLDDPLRQRVLRALDVRGLDLRPGALQDQVLGVINEVRREGGWGPQIDRFIEDNHLPPLRREERRNMLRSLNQLKLDPTSGNPALVHTIARVYEEMVGSSGGTDPVVLTRPTGRITPWSFRIKPFESATARQVRPESVLAAGALGWCYEIGERMGVYRVADALVYRWWIGQADFRDPDLVAQLYRYYKLRDERLPEEERGLLYRRILGLGATEVSGRIVVNEDFPALWRLLMEEISAYIGKRESSFRDDQISRQGIYQAARELQYNLSEHMVGMSLLQVTEMYNQLRSEDNSGNLGALDLLEHPEVIAQFAAGQERHVASVIRRMATEEFGVAPNIGSIATSADNGYAVFEWLADYQPGVPDADAFDELIEAGKAWILAQQAAGEGLSTFTGDGPPEDEEDDPNLNADWDDEELG